MVTSRGLPSGVVCYGQNYVRVFCFPFSFTFFLTGLIMPAVHRSLGFYTHVRVEIETALLRSYRDVDKETKAMDVEWRYIYMIDKGWSAIHVCIIV